MFCSNCGTEVNGAPVVPAEPVEVTLARLDKERAIEVAKIQARQEREYNETRVEVAEIESAADVAVGEATAEVVAAAIAPDPVTEPDPLVIDAPTLDAPPAEPEPEDAPPPAEQGEHEESPRKASGLGMW